MKLIHDMEKLGERVGLGVENIHLKVIIYNCGAFCVCFLMLMVLSAFLSIHQEYFFANQSSTASILIAVSSILLVTLLLGGLNHNISSAKNQTGIVALGVLMVIIIGLFKNYEFFVNGISFRIACMDNLTTGFVKDITFTDIKAAFFLIGVVTGSITLLDILLNTGNWTNKEVKVKEETEEIVDEHAVLA
ncbi:MAG: hypothetical protein MUF42_08110 [Cytophagaceae bacterium]|jgi:hypothetical protein|nr:hypothetical protein [Cytophagaceae bacterium]